MNENLLLEYNIGKSRSKIVLNKSCIIYKSDITIFDGTVIRDILYFINNLHVKYKNINIPISFEFGRISFRDKLTYIIFESICYILIKKYNHNIYVKFTVLYNIWTEGINSSPLLLLTTKEKSHIKKFISKYFFDIYKNHYRRILSIEDMKNEKLSKIMDEINYFLNFYKIVEQCLDEITEVIIELIGNVSEHTNSSCIIDIDVTTPYTKTNETGIFYGINLNILNFSEDLFGDLIKRRILDCSTENNERYTSVKKAYDFHKIHFSNSYREEDFFNIAAFQHKISGNILKTSTGGTGLTKLICSLEKRSDSHNCYLITGNRTLWFLHELLEYNDDNWIGFNHEKDFISHIPENKIVCDDTIYMPGTAYNLNFVMKGR